MTEGIGRGDKFVEEYRAREELVAKTYGSDKSIAKCEAELAKPRKSAEEFRKELKERAEADRLRDEQSAREAIQQLDEAA